MEKREFLEVLEYELGNLDAQNKAEIIADFTEHFDVASHAGKSEEEICRTLGDPREIAREFTADYGSQSISQINGHKNDEGRIWKYTDAVQPAQSQNYYDGEGLYDGALIKRLDAAHIKSVRLELISSDVEIRGAGDSHIRFDIDEDDESYFQTKISSDGIFLIKERRKNNSSSEIALGLPMDFPGNLLIQVKSGDVAVSDLHKLAKFILASGSGDAEVERVYCGENITASLASGNLEMSDTCAECIVIKTGSGDVELNKAQVKATISIGTGSGDIAINRCSVQGGFNVSTGSGDIESSRCSGKFRASTGSGNVEISSHSGTAWASTGSGDININTDEITDDVTYTTGSGEVVIACKKTSADIRIASGSGDVEFVADEVNGDLNAKTASGNIRVSLGRDSDMRFTFHINRHGSLYNEFVNRENARYKAHIESNIGDIEVRVI